MRMLMTRKFTGPVMADVLQQRLSDCIDDVAQWMMSNRLQLNHAKTEVLWCASPRRQQQIPTGPVLVSSNSVFPVATVRDLGSLFRC